MNYLVLISICVALPNESEHLCRGARAKPIDEIRSLRPGRVSTQSRLWLG